MPYFTDSFWSSDLKSAIETLFKGLFNNCLQNELFIKFFANQMEIQVMSAKKRISNFNECLKEIEAMDLEREAIEHNSITISGSGGGGDGGGGNTNSSTSSSLIELNYDMRLQGKQSLEIASLIEETVLQPFSKWCREHKQRLEYSDKILRDNILNFHKFIQNLDTKLEQQYLNKCRLLQDFKTTLPPHTIQEMETTINQWDCWLKFVEKEKEYAHYTTLCNGTIDVDIKTMKMILESLLLEMPKEEYKGLVFGYNMSHTNTGRDIAEWLVKIMSLEHVKQAEFIGQELLNLNFLKDCNNNLSLKKSTFVSSEKTQYQWKQTAYDFINVNQDTLKKNLDENNVPDLDAGWENEKVVVNLSEVDKDLESFSLYDESNDAGEQEDCTDVKDTSGRNGRSGRSTRSSTINSMSVGHSMSRDDMKDKRDESLEKLSIPPIFSPPQQPKRLLSELEMKYQKLVKEMKLANWKYFEGVIKADKLRCSVEELILDHLGFMEKCERDRLYAIKKATNDLQNCYESAGQLMTLPTTNFKIDPELDLKNFVLKYRVGVYQPVPIIYKNYFGAGNKMMDRQIFGIDLSIRCRLDHSKVPKIISKFLKHFDNDVYPELENDETRCSIWTESVRLNETHQLRFKLNNSFKLKEINLHGENISPSVIASVLKIYLLELPIPLIPQELNDVLKKIYHITETNEDEDSAVKDNDKFIALANVFSRIPKLHLATIDAISTHFVRLLSIIEKSNDSELPGKFAELISQEFANCIIRWTSFNDNVLGYKLFKDLLNNKRQIFDLLKKNIKQLNELNN